MSRRHHPDPAKRPKAARRPPDWERRAGKRHARRVTREKLGTVVAVDLDSTLDAAAEVTLPPGGHRDGSHPLPPEALREFASEEETAPRPTRFRVWKTAAWKRRSNERAERARLAAHPPEPDVRLDGPAAGVAGYDDDPVYDDGPVYDDLEDTRLAVDDRSRGFLDWDTAEVTSTD